MTAAAQRVRRLVFQTFAEEGGPPSPNEIARRLGLEPHHVSAALDELHEAHALVLTRDRDAIRMAHPFSARPMGFVVRDGDRRWWGGCAWDSFGIAAALRPTPGAAEIEIETSCPGCGTRLTYGAPPPRDTEMVVRIPKPAREWWDDVVATCTAIRTFCNAEHVNEAGGTLVPLSRLHQLAVPWYGDRLDPDWQPRPPHASQRILEQTGLTGDFWRLPGA